MVTKTNVRRIHNDEAVMRSQSNVEIPPNGTETVRSRFGRGMMILLVDLIIIIAVMIFFESSYSAIPYAAKDFEGGRGVFSVVSCHDGEMGRQFQLRLTPSQENTSFDFDAPYAVRFLLLNAGETVWERSWSVAEFVQKDDFFFETLWDGRHQMTHQVLPEGRYTAVAEVGLEERPRLEANFDWNPRRGQ